MTPLIAKIPPKRKDGRSSFQDLLTYCLGPQPDKKYGRAAYVNSRNVRGIDSAALEMASVASFNVRCKDPVFHFILSWRELELPTNEQVDEAVGIALKELDLQDCQAVWALQTDTENRHAHVVVNRIDPETGKAIQPAGNWTYKALERAARKIEMAQGWEIEKTGRYASKDGEVLELKDRLEETVPRISQTARDIEAHTAEKSAERIGQEKAAPIIRKAKTWAELHQKLAEQSISFERKGSGAVLHIGESVIKASQAGRDMSLSKLEKRLGEYRERDVSIEIGASKPEAVERVKAAPKVKRSWDDYLEARKEYHAAKDKAALELKTRQKYERDTLNKEQKEERKRLFEISWQGKGAKLNQRRSLMAANQQKAKLDLSDRQEKERKELKANYPLRFPNFKAWLDQEANPELAALFRYQNQLLFLGDNAAGIGSTDLRDYTPIEAQKGGVAYVKKEKKKDNKGFFSHLLAPQADFIDYGRKILLSKDCDEAAIIAAFQLASQKWGAVQINGTEEYKKMCVDIAIKHNFKIANPDLKLVVENARVKDKDAARTQDEARQKAEVSRARRQRPEKLFERYADAVGADRFRIVATEFTPEGVKAFVFDKKNGGLAGKTREEIIEAMPKLHIYTKYNKNICVVPMSDSKHHILVDDLTPEKLRQFKEDGYSPACVIESSPGNFQAIVTISKLGADTEMEKQAANRLTRELNQQYGDPKLSGAVHAHRLPPFPNLKPKHLKEDGTFPETTLTEDNGGQCQKAARQLAEIQERIKREAQTREQRARSQIFAESAGANDPNAAYWSHYRDIISRLDTPDYSSVDGKIGIRMRVTGYSAGQIYEAIKNNAPAMRKETMSAAEWSAKYHSRDWSRFAKETVEKYVFGRRGASQYSQAESFRPYYLKVEERNTNEETRHTARKDLGR